MNEAIAPTTGETPYATLSPDTVLDAVDATGLLSDGRQLALNSYENRVYQVGLDDGGFVVAKFYRPGRWSDEAILEEHAFSIELADAELPVVAPMAVDGDTLFRHAGFRYALYPRRGGRAPALESDEQLSWMGRLVARMHNVGARTAFRHREVLDRHTFIERPARAVLGSDLLTDYLRDSYATAIADLDLTVAACFERVGALQSLRLHGDCHPGNVLWTDAGPHFVDLDDARSGPAIQDLWMLADDPARLDVLIDGYLQFRDLDPAEPSLVPALRAMRQAHHAGWIAERWHDPAFPVAFPYAAEARWWQQHIGDLRDLAAEL